MPKAQNRTALGFKKPLEGRINVTDRRMSVKDLIVNGDEPYQPVKVSSKALFKFSSNFKANAPSPTITTIRLPLWYADRIANRATLTLY